MSEIEAGFIGALIPSIMFGISKWFDHKKLKSEEKRWLATNFLKLEIDTLRELHIKNVNCLSIYAKYWEYPKEAFEDFYKIIQPSFLEYLNALAMATVYLDIEGEDKIFGELSKFLKIVNNAILEQKINELNWGKYIEIVDNANIRMAHLLKPESLKQYIENIEEN